MHSRRPKTDARNVMGSSKGTAGCNMERAKKTLKHLSQKFCAASQCVVMYSSCSSRCASLYMTTRYVLRKIFKYKSIILNIKKDLKN